MIKSTKKSRKAERTGFEPAERFDPFTELAIRRFRPLSHRSVAGPEKSDPVIDRVEIVLETSLQRNPRLLRFIETFLTWWVRGSLALVN